jgi:apolipoprotein D and lipocalin family protein
MAKYSGSGWRFQSQRHREARLTGSSPKIVDLKKYSGTWKQTSVKNEPYFQRGCEKVTATYKPIKDEKIKVTNRCYKKGEKVKKIIGTARSVSKSNKKLKVSFFPPFEGDYKIVKINPTYTKATVKSGKTVWQLQKV